MKLRRGDVPVRSQLPVVYTGKLLPNGFQYIVVKGSIAVGDPDGIRFFVTEINGRNEVKPKFWTIEEAIKRLERFEEEAKNAG